MRQTWFSSAVLAVLVLKCPPPNWMHNDLSVGALAFGGTPRQTKWTGPGWWLHYSQSLQWHPSIPPPPPWAEDHCMYTVQWLKIWTPLPRPPLLPLPPALQEDERRPCSVIRCLSVLEGSSDRLQEAAFMPDDGDHRKQKCLFVPPGPGMSTISRGQYQILPSSSPNTHSCVRSGGILHQRERQTTRGKATHCGLLMTVHLWDVLLLLIMWKNHNSHIPTSSLRLHNILKCAEYVSNKIIFYCHIITHFFSPFCYDCERNYINRLIMNTS